MEKVRKLIDLEEDVLIILEQEAKKQKRSLKNLLEYIIEETARKLESPSAEYQAMMDDMLQRLEKDEVNFSPMRKLK
ncbi:hypothetical protein RM545_09265 [Zunongwangia sp. F260]|uniref:CopG family transcriptional regulator n=1 Tax=Autumnicola lenta TaxID=3075593 RepID=A0ABU3CKK5_9FLAO|nr:hypothetical protein [Zunongwangia sp. F260]MDT0646880.1 hypothetical protein [Zunongwangia sp. F260]